MEIRKGDICYGPIAWWWRSERSPRGLAANRPVPFFRVEKTLLHSISGRKTLLTRKGISFTVVTWVVRYLEFEFLFSFTWEPALLHAILVWEEAVLSFKRKKTDGICVSVKKLQLVAMVTEGICFLIIILNSSLSSLKVTMIVENKQSDTLLCKSVPW